ncbi:hypothetical protein [Phenylobacterium sp.]|uniref:hypothetical protein n=1 Tax=Phenylobacterium sp. TaxID=1871053 RepID=UPI00271B4396|nr:hypothetical protein [Phenylobacterium sp.]MDO8381267.1 hypothetical protein [Phenylobacterium sp.]
MSQRVLRRLAAVAAISSLAGLAHAQAPVTVSPGAQLAALRNGVVSLHPDSLTVLARNPSALSDQVGALRVKYVPRAGDLPTAGGVNPLACSAEPGGPGFNCTPVSMSVPGERLGAGTAPRARSPN